MAFDATISGSSANSLVTEIYADDYFADRSSNTSWSAVTSKTAELIGATDFISLFTYGGSRATSAQALPHPRSGMLNREKTDYVSDADIADDIKKAVCELALFTANNPDAFGEADNITELQAGPLKLKLEIKAFGEYSSLPLDVQRLLDPYISTSSSGGSGGLRRG